MFVAVWSSLRQEQIASFFFLTLFVVGFSEFLASLSQYLKLSLGVEETEDWES